MICKLVETIVRAICLCFFFGGQDDDKREREDCPSHITTSSPKKGNAKEFVSVELCRLNTRAHHFHQQHWHCHRLFDLFGLFVCSFFFLFFFVLLESIDVVYPHTVFLLRLAGGLFASVSPRRLLSPLVCVLIFQKLKNKRTTHTHTHNTEKNNTRDCPKGSNRLRCQTRQEKEKEPTSLYDTTSATSTVLINTTAVVVQ